MPLDVLALVVFVAVAAAGGWLIRDRVSRIEAARTGEPACLACGTPAQRMSPDSFLCPGCGRDVRARGLAVRNTGTFTGPFWRVVTFSAVLCAVALLVTSLATLALPRYEYVSEDASVWQSDGEVRFHMEFSTVGRRVGDAPQPRLLEGEVHADFFLTGGEVFTLEVQSPALRYRVLDTEGRERLTWSPPGAFDQSAALQWMVIATGSRDDYRVRDAAGSAYAQLHRMLGLPAPTPTASWRGSSGGGSSGSSYAGPPAYVTPAALIVWSLLWLGGVWRILRRPRETAQATPAPQGARP